MAKNEKKDYGVADLWSDLSPEAGTFFGLMCKEFALEDPDQSDIYALLESIREEVDMMAFDEKRGERGQWLPICPVDVLNYILQNNRVALRETPGLEEKSDEEKWSAIRSRQTYFRALVRIKLEVLSFVNDGKPETR